MAEGVKRKLNVDSPTLDNLELVEFSPPEIKLLDKLNFVNLTTYDSVCDFYLTHNDYGRANALLYENELNRRAYV